MKTEASDCWAPLVSHCYSESRSNNENNKLHCIALDTHKYGFKSIPTGYQSDNKIKSTVCIHRNRCANRNPFGFSEHTHTHNPLVDKLLSITFYCVRPFFYFYFLFTTFFCRLSFCRAELNKKKTTKTSRILEKERIKYSVLSFYGRIHRKLQSNVLSHRYFCWRHPSNVYGFQLSFLLPLVLLLLFFLFNLLMYAVMMMSAICYHIMDCDNLRTCFEFSLKSSNKFISMCLSSIVLVNYTQSTWPYIRKIHSNWYWGRKWNRFLRHWATMRRLINRQL